MTGGTGGVAGTRTAGVAQGVTRETGGARQRPRVALVVGSGSVKCAAAVGLWRVLQREGIPIDVAIGCSGGSIYAAAVALGFDIDFSERHSLELWKDLFNRIDVRSLLRAVFPRLLRFNDRIGILDDRRVRDVIWMLFGGRTFEEARIPLYIAATDFANGEKVVLSEGNVADAVRASIALPLLLRPWPVNGRLLIDGGVSNPLPIDVGVREGCDIIIALGFENHYSETISSLAGAVGRTTTIVTNHLLRATFAFYNLAHHAEVLAIMPQFERRIGLSDAHEIPYIIAAGEQAMEEQLPYLRQLLAPSAGSPRL